MSISGQFASIQPVSVGDIVQLVYGQEGYVMKIYETGNFANEISGLRDIVALAVYGTVTYSVQRLATGLEITAWANGVMQWSRTIVVHLPTSIEMAAGAGGVYLVFFVESANVSLPGGVSVASSPTFIVVRFSSTGDMIAYTTLTGVLHPKLTIDAGLSTAVIYGSSTKPLVLGKKTIISDTTLYSYAIILSPTLAANRVFKESDVVILHLVSNSANIAFTDREDNLTTLSFHGGTNNWNNSIGDLVSDDLIVFPSSVFVAGRVEDTNDWSIYQFAYSGNQLAQIQIPIPITDIILKTIFSYNGTRLLLYVISVLEDESMVLSEYDVFSDVIIWRTAIPSNTILIAGSNETVSSSTSTTIDTYGKRLPALAGVVAQVLSPTGSTGSTGSTGCCHDSTFDYPPLPNGTQPFVVIVDFLMTSAFAPVIPAQEYYLGDNQRATVIPDNSRYLGTAIDNNRVILAATFPPCCSHVQQ